MYILLNMSKKLEGFSLYKNTFYPLLRGYSLDVIDLSKSIDSVNMDFVKFRERVVDSLVEARTNKYSLIVLYDFDMQKQEPLVYSFTGILNNIECQIIEPIRHSYVIDNVFFVALDDVERDFDGQIIDENLKNSVSFDKNGYLEETDIPHYFKTTDFEFIDKGFITLVNQYKDKNKLSEYDNIFNEFEKEYLIRIEERIIKALDNDIPINDVWYEKKVKNIFRDYKKEIKSCLMGIGTGEETIENMGFSLKDYVVSNISSYYNIQQNKIFRLNLLDSKGKYCRDEAKYRSYYKIISFVNYLATEDKKYIFGGAYNVDENHYTINVSIDDRKIESMLNMYTDNLNVELGKLGDVKFSDIQVEEYEHFTIDTNIENTKKYTYKKPHFSLIKNDDDLKEIEEYAENLKGRYIDFVNYCNQRLRKITDKLRVTMHKDFVGRKTNVTLNELNRIIEEKETKARELKSKIASNTPNDIIQIDFQIFDENEKNVKKASEILNKRITLFHFLFNIAVVAFCSLIIFPFTRRFDYGFVGSIIKLVLWLSPALYYIIVQLIYCNIKVNEVNKIMNEMDNYTKSKINGINRDDDKFKIYVNDIYELMMLTKYIDKLNANANSNKVDIENYRYQKQELTSALNNISNLSKLLKVSLNNHYANALNIPLDIDRSVEDNDAYCPLMYLPNNPDKYILINNQHQEKLVSPLLNLVDNIKFDYDEVYDENVK